MSKHFKLSTPLRRFANACGYDFRRPQKMGRDPIADMARLAQDESIDIACIGPQARRSVGSIKGAFPSARIHMPGPEAQGETIDTLDRTREMFTNNAMTFALCDVDFSDANGGYPSFDQLYAFMSEMNYQFVSFYAFDHKDELASRTDALFVHKSALL